VTDVGVARQMAEHQGVKLVLFVGGDLEIAHNGKTVRTQSYMDADNVYIRADHPVYTAEQLMIRYEIDGRVGADIAIYSDTQDETKLEHNAGSGINEMWMGNERLRTAGMSQKEAAAATSAVEDVFANTKIDVQTMSQKIDKVLDQFCKHKSKWSGKTVVLPRKDMLGVVGRNEWNCDITLREDAGIKTVIHEHLHARSISYYDSNTYLKFKNIEEGSVELLAQEICKRRGAEFKESYSDIVKPLRIINSIVKIGDEYSFARQLFDTPLPERYNWLVKKANKIISLNILSSKTIYNLKTALKIFEEEA